MVSFIRFREIYRTLQQLRHIESPLVYTSTYFAADRAAVHLHRVRSGHNATQAALTAALRSSDPKKKQKGLEQYKLVAAEAQAELRRS